MKESQLTIGFVGCGSMGGAVLYGLLDALYPEADQESPITSQISGFIATTKTSGSANKLAASLGRHGPRVLVIHDETVRTIRDSDVVVLGFKPHMAERVLSEPGVADALAEKLVVSLLAGLSIEQLCGLITAARGHTQSTSQIHLARAVPNIAARYRQSMTILEVPPIALPTRESQLVEWIFLQVGQIKYLAADLVDSGSMVMTAAIATLSIPFEGLLDGSVTQGLRRADAMDLAMQGVKGLTSIMENGVHPSVMREAISSPRGCTIQSILTVEKAATRAVFAQAVIDGAQHFKRADTPK